MPSDAIEPPFNSRLFTVQQERLTSDDVYTPSWIFDALDLRFDLDVCAPPGGVPWVPADRIYTQADDGLVQPWEGRVWMNPPYRRMTPWVFRFIEHRHGVAILPFARSRWFGVLWETADAIAVPTSASLMFKWASGEQIMFPIHLAAFGPECVDAIAHVGMVRSAA